MNYEIDKNNLRQVILEYPNQFKIGQTFAKNIKPELKNPPSNLIICGMGGSALPGDFLIAYLQEKKIRLPIYISRDYSLPYQTDENSLIFISSYSGNTEETIACFQEALKIKLSIVAFTEGGQVKKIAEENDIPYVKYQIDFENFQPRYAVCYAFAAMNEVLTNLGISARISNLPKIDSRSNEVYGETLAKKAKNKIPVIYSSEKFGFLAKTWKIKINENSKATAFWNVFPALNHNEMVGFSSPKHEYCVFILKDSLDHPSVQKRMDLTTQLYRDRGIEVEIIDIQGENFLEKVLTTSVLGDWISYYLALEYNQDPNPVVMVEEFKLKLK